MSVALVTAYTTAYNRLRLLAGTQIGQLWDRVGGLDDAALEQFLRQALPLMAGAEAAQARLTIGYLTTLRRQTLGSAPVVNIDVRDIIGTNLRGVDPTEVFARPTITARTAISQGKDFLDAVGLARQRATELAETNVMLTQRATVAHMGTTDKRVVGYRRVLTGNSCVLCATASTQRYHRGQLHPIHAHCIPGGSVVSGSPIRALTRRWYEGELIIIRTALGDDLSVTPNHPVLTDRGWRPAGIVQEGDELFRHRPLNGAVERGPNEQQPPALVEDVWRANSVHGFVSIPLAAEDLHADGAGTDGEIEIVWTDRYLPSERDVFVRQPFSDSHLMLRQTGRTQLSGGGSLALLGPSVLTASGTYVSGGGLGLALCPSHLRSAIEPSNAPVARYDAPTEQFTFESVAVYTSKGLDLVRRLAGKVEADRVVHASRVRFSGHVYNLYTDEGWYSSNNHIVSNCDCGVAEIYGTADPGHVINSHLLEQLKISGASGELSLSSSVARAKKSITLTDKRMAEIRTQIKAEKDVGRQSRLQDRLDSYQARRQRDQEHMAVQSQQLVDFRQGRIPPNVVTVHQHGELGPVLTPAGQHFTTEAQALH